MTTASSAQAPGAATPLFDGRRLQLKTDTFAQYIVRGDDTSSTGLVVSTLRAEGRLLTRIYRMNNEATPQYDSIVDRLSDLHPVAHAMYSDVVSTRVRFAGGAVTGWVRVPNGDTISADMSVPPDVYNAASFDVLVRASPLRDGLELNLSGFRAGPGAVVAMRGRVTGSASVDDRSCWVFKGYNGGVPVVFWIDKETRALRRMTMHFKPDEIYLLAARPPRVAPFTDTEKQGLIVTDQALRLTEFAVVVPLPKGSFARDSKLQTIMSGSLGDRADLFTWAMTDSMRPGFAVIVEVLKGFRGTEAAFRAFIKTTWGRGFSREQGWEIIEDSVYWAGRRREYRMSIRNPQGLAIACRCIPSPPLQSPAVVACVQTISGEKDEVELVLGGLAFDARH